MYLTSVVMTVGYDYRKSYKIGDSRVQRSSQGTYINDLLSSYAEAVGDIGDDTAHNVIKGKRTIPIGVVMYYVDGTSRCPTQVYDDVLAYYDTHSQADIQKMWADLMSVLDIIPEASRLRMLHAAYGYPEGRHRVCALLATLMYYAWRMDHAAYAYPLH